MLIIAGPNETLRLFGVLAVIFGGIRLFVLLRTRSNDEASNDGYH